MSANKIAWLTDIHLNFLKNDARIKFYQSITKTDANAILITGDIAEANDVCEILSEFSAYTNMSIYFVLGNHDYYSGSINNVREKIITLCNKNTNLIWLGKPEVIALNKHSVLVGHDGWADAEILDHTLNKAINAKHKKVIIATHVPPFPACSWHKDKPSDKNWLPYFASKATGDVIAAIAQKHPGIEFLVLCGHTHTRKVAKIASNLEVRAGAAEYYQPAIQEFIES